MAASWALTLDANSAQRLRRDQYATHIGNAQRALGQVAVTQDGLILCVFHFVGGNLEYPAQLRVLDGLRKRGVNTLTQLVQWFVAVFWLHPVEGLHQRQGDAGNHRIEQIGFVLKVPIDGTPGDTRLPGQSPATMCASSSALKDALGSIQVDPVSGVRLLWYGVPWLGDFTKPLPLYIQYCMYTGLQIGCRAAYCVTVLDWGPHALHDRNGSVLFFKGFHVPHRRSSALSRNVGLSTLLPWLRYWWPAVPGMAHLLLVAQVARRPPRWCAHGSEPGSGPGRRSCCLVGSAPFASPARAVNGVVVKRLFKEGSAVQGGNCCTRLILLRTKAALESAQASLAKARPTGPGQRPGRTQQATGGGQRRQQARIHPRW